MSFILPELEKVQLVSFDVFDTMIARRCGPPQAIFGIVGEKIGARGILAIGSSGFQKMRMEAEQRARRFHAPSEIRLADIYRELNGLWMLPQPALDRIVDCELETETENLFVIPGAAEMVQQAVQLGKRVAFVSDMYLPADFIRATLMSLGIMRESDALYVSSEWGVTKADGGLFHLLLQNERLACEEILHVGDSFKVDYQMACRTGLKAVHHSRGGLNRHEEALSHSESRDTGVSTLAGLARRARLETDSDGVHEIAARLGASIAGPLLTCYAEWVLRTAKARGLKNLYFLARDGEALLLLCEKLASALGASEIQLHYLYGSRQVWYPAALRKMDDDAASFFADKVAFNSGSWEECVELLGFKRSDFTSLPLARRWSTWSPNAENKRSLFLDLVRHERFGPALKIWIEQQAGLATRYLRELGLMEPEPCGLVDCGWSGTWTDLLCDLIEAEGGSAPEVYFIGKRKTKQPARARTFAFLYDHQSNCGLDRIPDFFHVVIEFFLTSGHGRTVGLQEKDDRLVPILAATDLQGFTREEWEAYRNALLRFAELYAVQLQANDNFSDLREALLSPVALLWERPSRGEAEFFGKHTIGLDPSANGRLPLARAYRVSDLFRLAFRFKLPGYPPFWWHEGAQALTPRGLRFSIGTLWRLQELARLLGGGIISWQDIRFLMNAVVLAAKKVRWEMLPPRDGAGARSPGASYSKTAATAGSPSGDRADGPRRVVPQTN